MDYIILGNDFRAWAMALGVALAAYLLGLLIKKIVVRGLNSLSTRTATNLDDIAVAVVDSTHSLFLLVIALYAGSQMLVLPAKAHGLVQGCAMVALFAQIALWGDKSVREWLHRYRERNMEQNAAITTSTAALGFVVRAAIWLIIVLMILDNFGVNITTLVASLGIGGIAVALALQNILGDLFSSLSIVLDKPFVVGDFITVDGVSGTVEYVGLKTTRLRGLGGEQIIFSNSDLLKARIHNYKRMQTRRIAFAVGVTYETDVHHLRTLPGVIGEIITRLPKARFDRAHLKGMGASSLDFEVVYYVESPDYQVYMDVQQAINLELIEYFASEDIDFAYPTQTLHHVGLGRRLTVVSDNTRPETGADTPQHDARADSRSR
ncbi:mechanosensitive ion channel family protein [Massilia sp. PAMC28688]|uniref:mechanosensitive ion channel family protein n=1 Tax=Massilia sp. PAMC28688 TaxID=2861283 RepID=UPI001C62B384|nr:mechanosensitive ion channel family protein [Massilia sp. PAMC28688]QYF95408.1 mechanosensitive ion channel family protein [Massilia sp. PAMC28688]